MNPVVSVEGTVKCRFSLYLSTYTLRHRVAAAQILSFIGFK